MADPALVQRLLARRLAKKDFVSLGKVKCLHVTLRAVLVLLLEPLDPKRPKVWVPKSLVTNLPTHPTKPGLDEWAKGDVGELCVARSFAVESDLA